MYGNEKQSGKMLIIGDEEERYALKLAEYAEFTGDFSVTVFTEASRLSAYIRENVSEDQVYLLEENLFRSVYGSSIGDAPENSISGLSAVSAPESSGIFPKSKPQPQLYCLTKDKEKASGSFSPEAGVRYIYKYQSAAKILGTVSETDPKPAFPEHTDHRFVPYGGISDPPVITPENHLICIYSPIGHALKTTLCLTLGELLSKEAKVLYINMEGYSGLEKMLGIRNERNFSDLIYDHTLNGEDVLHALQSYLKEKNGLWYMVPSSEAELQEMEPEQLLAVLSFLDNSSGFDHILLDPGPCVRGLTELLKLCGLVLMPVRSDRISMAKIDEFREFLASAPGKTGGDPAGSSLTERFRELKLPFFEEIGKEQRMGLRSSKILADHLRKEGLLSTIAYTRKPKP